MMSPTLRNVALFLCAAAAGCSDGDPCSPLDAVERARAIDATHVEVVLRCPVKSRPEAVTVEALTAPEEGPLPVHAVTGKGTLVIETAPYVGLREYTVRIADVPARDGSRFTASANFVGVGDVTAAGVLLQVDDRYHQSLDQVFVQVTFDPQTGVYTHHTNVIELLDPDGDHVYTAEARVAVDPMRTVSLADDRLGDARRAYAAKAVTSAGVALSNLVTFEVTAEEAGMTVDLPLLTVPKPPGPEGFVAVNVQVDDTPSRALTSPALRVSVDAEGGFDAAFPTTLPLSDADGDGIWEATAQVRIDPRRVAGGSTSETFPYVMFVANAGVDYPGVGVQVVAHDEEPVEAAIRIGNPALVPVTFRVDVSRAYLNRSGSLRGLFAGEAPFLTGEFGQAEDAFGQNAADAFTGGENVVLQMRPRADFPGVWERTLFLPPDRPYGWKVVRCPASIGCADLNRAVTSSGRAFATVMKNLVTENRDAQTGDGVKVVDPREPSVEIEGSPMSYAGAVVYVGEGTGNEPDPAGTPDGDTLFKQELPDLVVEVGTEAVTTPVIVVGTWRDVNLPSTLAEIIASSMVFDLNPWDYDAGFVGAAPPSYELPAPPAPPPFTVGDGMLDPAAMAVPGGGAATMTIYAAVSGTILYLAVEDAGEGSDHFLFLSAEAPGTSRPAPWGKAGTVAFPASALLLADENDNGFAGWFELGSADLLETAGADAHPHLAVAIGGGWMEATVDLAELFGELPATLYFAAGPWDTADAGPLYFGAQMPATADGDGNIDANEVAAVPTTDLEVSP